MKQMSLLQCPDPKLVLPPDVGFDDFARVIHASRPSVSADEVKDLEEFTTCYGPVA